MFLSLMIRVFSGSPFPVNTIYSLIFKDVINIVSTYLSALLTITVLHPNGLLSVFLIFPTLHQFSGMFFMRLIGKIILIFQSIS